MNFKKILIFSLIFSLHMNMVALPNMVGPSISWFKPLLYIGNMVKSYCMTNKKNFGCACVGFVAGIFGYKWFDRLRDWKINRIKQSHINQIRQVIQTQSSGVTGPTTIANTTWSKPWSFIIEGHGSNGSGQMKVTHGYVETIPVAARVKS